MFKPFAGFAVGAFGLGSGFVGDFATNPFSDDQMEAGEMSRPKKEAAGALS
jgi:hypothetical protein